MSATTSPAIATMASFAQVRITEFAIVASANAAPSGMSLVILLANAELPMKPASLPMENIFTKNAQVTEHANVEIANASKLKKDNTLEDTAKIAP